MQVNTIISTTDEQTKYCSKCNQPKPLDAFAWNSHKVKDGIKKYRRDTCKQCGNDYARQYKKNPPPKRTKLTADQYREKRRSWVRKQKLKTFYNLTEDGYQAMLEAQGGVCAICGKPETWVKSSGKVCPLSVDHDHITNKVRELICARCNHRLSLIEHSYFPHLAYLKKHSSAVIVDLLS